MLSVLVPIFLTLLFPTVRCDQRPIIKLNVTRRVRVPPKNTDPLDWASSHTLSDFIKDLDLLYQARLIINWLLPHILLQSFHCVFCQIKIVSKTVKYSLYEATMASKTSFLASNLFLFRPWLSILRPVYGFPSWAIFPNLGTHRSGVPSWWRGSIWWWRNATYSMSGPYLMLPQCGRNSGHNDPTIGSNCGGRAGPGQLVGLVTL